ncbi:hypothetical protein BaRGS_00031384, partial [Batillaria attramentaria]
HFSNDWNQDITCNAESETPDPPIQQSKALLMMGFVQECVEASDSTQADKRYRQKQTKNRIRPLSGSRDDPDRIVEYIADTIDHEECVKNGLQALRELLDLRALEHDGTPQPPVTIKQASKNLITLAMWDNIGNPEPNDVLFTPEVLAIVNKVMTTHRGCSDVQQQAAAFILALSANSRASETICQLGGIQDILNAMRDHPNDAQLQATCCSALWGLTVVESSAKIAAENCAVREVCTALKNHSSLSEVAEAAAAAMISLCLDDGCFDIVNKVDGVGSLLTAMDTHIKNAKVVRNICMVLSTLVEPNEECAYRVLTSDKPEDEKPAGIPIIIKAYELHRDNAEVVEAIVNLIMELCEYEDIRLDLNSYKVVNYLKEIHAKYFKNEVRQSDGGDSGRCPYDVNAEMRHVGVGPSMLSEVYKRYRENKDIMGPCETALDKLGAGKAMAPRRSSVQVK